MFPTNPPSTEGPVPVERVVLFPGGKRISAVRQRKVDHGGRRPAPTARDANCGCGGLEVGSRQQGRRRQRVDSPRKIVATLESGGDLLGVEVARRWCRCDGSRPSSRSVTVRGWVEMCCRVVLLERKKRGLDFVAGRIGFGIRDVYKLCDDIWISSVRFRPPVSWFCVEGSLWTARSVVDGECA